MRFKISLRARKESKSKHPRKRVSGRTIQRILQYRQAFSRDPSVIDIGIDAAENRASKVRIIAMISEEDNEVPPECSDDGPVLVIDLPANTINYEDGFLPSHKPDDAPLVSDRSKSELHDKVPLDRACLLRPIYILQYSSSFFIIKNSKSRVNARFPVVCFTIFATCTSMLLYFKYIWQTCTVHMDMIPNREWTHSLSLAKIVENASFDVANAIIFEKSTECVEGDVF